MEENTDFFTPEQVEEQVAWLRQHPPAHQGDQRYPGDRQLIEDLQRLYQSEQADARSLEQIWSRLESQGVSASGQSQRLPHAPPPHSRPSARPYSSPAAATIPPPRSRLRARAVVLTVALLLVVLVGSLVTGLVLVHHPTHVISHPTTTPGGGVATATPGGGAATATSQPQSPQGLVYAVSNKNTVVALDAATGSTRWQQPFTLASGAELDIAAIADQTVYVKTLVSYPSRGQDILTALHASDGTQVWQTHVNLDHGLTISGGLVITLNSTGYVLSALDAQTGKSLWSFQPGTNLTYAWGEVGSNTLYTEGFDSQNNGVLYAVNISNGTERWHLQGSGGVSSYFSWLAVTDDSLYVDSPVSSQPASATQAHPTAVLSALNASDGTERWHIQTNQADESWLSATVLNGIVYASATDVITQNPNSSGILYALQASDGKELWRKQPVQEKSFFSPLTVSQGTVYISDNNGMYAFNGGSGQQLWYTTSGGWANGVGQPPVVQDGLAYMDWYGNSTTTQGNTTVFLSVLDASSGKERWRFVLFDGSGRDAPNIEADPGWLVANGGVYVLTYGATGAPGVQALRASDGKPLWQNNTLTSLMVAAN